MLNLYDTLSKTIKPINAEGRTVRLYSCGPTVYNQAHIGNLRSFVFADLLKRVLEFNDQRTDWVMNITDVDDKTIKNTIDEFGPTAGPDQLQQFTEKYTTEFLADLNTLNINTDQIRLIKVSEVISQIQDFILALIEKGYAYKAEDGSTYFSIEKYQTDFGDYGALVGAGFLEGKKVGARVAVDEYEKDNLSDFALWKAHQDDDGQVFWTHPELGNGRPGWHIECSAINSIAFNSQPTDLHTGGVDLIFPHHTNEIAQTQPFYKPFVNHWAHSEHLQINDQKMAKRDKNFLVLKDLTSQSSVAGPALRYLYFQTDFRNLQNFTTESFAGALTAIKSLFNKFETAPEGKIDQAIIEKLKSVLNENLNTAKALAILHEALDGGASKNTITKMDEIFGFGLSKEREQVLPEEVQNLVDQRAEARTNKDFAKSDELRGEIEKLDYEVKDTPNGQRITKK